MTITKTEICNRALSAFGADSTISDVDTEDSNEAIQCRLLYNSARDEVLEGALWNFARRTILLHLLKALPGTPEGGTTNETVWQPEWPTPPWLYSYRYPTDCIKARYIIPGSGLAAAPGIFGAADGRYDAYLTEQPPIKFVISNELSDDNDPVDIKVVNTNQPEALLIYTLRVNDIDFWSTLAVEAFVNALAVKLARSIPGDKELVKQCAEFYIRNMAMAQASNGNESLVPNDVMPDWIRARGLCDTSEGWVVP